jgi:hypothetical protein
LRSLTVNLISETGLGSNHTYFDDTQTSAAGLGGNFPRTKRGCACGDCAPSAMPHPASLTLRQYIITTYGWPRSGQTDRLRQTAFNRCRAAATYKTTVGMETDPKTEWYAQKVAQ